MMEDSCFKEQRILINIPYLSDIIKLVESNGFSINNLFDWFSVAYENMLLIQYESYFPWDSGIHYQLDKLITDEYKSIIYHRLRVIPERYRIESIISIKPIGLDAVSIHCRMKE